MIITIFIVMLCIYMSHNAAFSSIYILYNNKQYYTGRVIPGHRNSNKPNYFQLY